MYGRKDFERALIALEKFEGSKLISEVPEPYGFGDGLPPDNSIA